jgi:large subunit ribosomal protein L28
VFARFFTVMRLFTAARPIAALAPNSSSASPSAFHIHQPLRTFTTTLPQQSKTIKASRLPSDLIPPYPYGERRVYKQSNRGLYGSARLQFGNLVAKSGLSKARRFWRPNIHVKNFYVSELDARIKTRLTLRVLKTIRREGGLVNYLLKSKPARIKELGPSGWRLRWLVMQTRAVQERFNDERVELGLEPKEIVDKSDIIHYAMDYATPGGLNARSRAIAEKMKEGEGAADDMFELGDDIPEDAEVGEFLSDEAEEALMKDSNRDMIDAKVKAERGNIHV